MFPIDVFDDAVNAAIGNCEIFAEFNVTGSGIMKTSDLTNDRLSQNGGTNPLSFGMFFRWAFWQGGISSLARTIIRIVLVGTEKEMIPVDAAANIANMASLKIERVNAFADVIGNARRYPKRSDSINRNADLSIAVGIYSTVPYPAFIGIADNETRPKFGNGFVRKFREWFMLNWHAGLLTGQCVRGQCVLQHA